ncbi:hypothetical protein BD410DRAFT_794111 [Rickenella mellea]|uniref:Uncharacterized protein n=1 Tax=Rickenella mellea TaxID=50990 RepID=A0A4Y7PSW0_9AGAM|nr:hypothetical protein BD410DRAFT_794111 [Rickenella mellea]
MVASPVFRIPAEILSHIFLACLPDEFTGEDIHPWSWDACVDCGERYRWQRRDCGAGFNLEI